jgi:hypothetical protein
MARSKKDGRQGAGHRLQRKWQKTSARRRAAARKAARESAMAEYEADQRALDAELVREFEQQMEEDGWDWVNDYQDWRGLNDAMYSDEDIEYGHYDPYDQYRNEDYEGIYDRDWPDQYPVVDVFQAVDRAVRRHGVEAARKQAHMLAAALDVPVWAIESNIRLTRAGYING